MNNNLYNKNILVGVTGGIAAYKTCELVRLLVKEGASVHVMLTEAAQHFVTPLTMQTLSKHPVHLDMFTPLPVKGNIRTEDKGHRLQTKDPQHQIQTTNHVSLADIADVIVVAPACANTIAKVSHGICDDLLTTTICATRAKVIFAPSMNVNMWENKITQENIARLKKLGYKFVDPEEGELACGYSGVGRMADIEKIVKAI